MPFNHEWRNWSKPTFWGIHRSVPLSQKPVTAGALSSEMEGTQEPERVTRKLGTVRGNAGPASGKKGWQLEGLPVKERTWQEEFIWMQYSKIKPF